MLRYGDTDVQELRFSSLRATIEPRDPQWIDVFVSFEVEARPPGVPKALGALIICTSRGDIAEMAPQDDGLDCEYQFTPLEKEQLRAFYEREVRPLLG